MKVTVDYPGWIASELSVRIESENQAESALLVVVGKRIKKPVKTFGYIMKDRTVLDIRIPTRKQKPRDDEFGNQE